MRKKIYIYIYFKEPSEKQRAISLVEYIGAHPRIMCGALEMIQYG